MRTVPKKHRKSVKQPAVLLSLLAFTTANYAQESGSEKSTSYVGIEEVVVTAQKRSENIRDVPLSMTALSGDFIKDAGIQNLNDIAKFTPNVHIDEGQMVAKIRGIGSNTGPLTDPSVATVFDGVYYGRAQYLFMGMFDIERVEILRGPQGLIVGKNASAGVLNFFSRRPDPETFLELTYGAGDFKEERRELIANTSILNDRLGIRFAYKKQESEGHIYNTKLDKMTGGRDNEMSRLSLAWDISHNMSLLLQFGHADMDYTEGAQFSLLTDQGRTLHEPSDPEIEDDWKNYQSSETREYYRGLKTDWAVAEFKWDLDDFELISVSGWSKAQSPWSWDPDNGPANLITFDSEENYKQISEEIRLVSAPGKFEYVAGLYFFNGDAQGNSVSQVGGISLTEFALGNLGPLGEALSSLPNLTLEISFQSMKV